MHLKNLAIKNFRVLEDIQVEFDNRVNVIVGPNASGKTTVLEAIRLTKAMLAPRTGNEAMQALFALGAASPHMPQRLMPNALARDDRRPVEIKCQYRLSRTEVDWLDTEAPQLATGLLLARMGQQFGSQTALVAFLSSDNGKQALAQMESEIRKALDAVKASGNQCRLELTIEPRSGRIASGEAVGPTLFAALDQRHPPHRASFSYFPADRAMPLGEQPVQLGAGDAGAQLESHNSQPQTKYARLKNTIFSAEVAGDKDRSQIRSEFARIFDGILRGRELHSVGISDIGLLSIKVRDTDTGRIFDVDGMSSGEKGLILTFLLVERSVADDGLILLDEPELHLNPAVCKHLLTFLVDGYVVRKNLQVIVCSHSPEILAGAFDREECSLYHLVSEVMLTKVRRKDQDVVAEALRSLGTSDSEGLLFKGTLFVEGEDDIALLETGFGDLLRRYKLKDLGGRREVEKQIVALQEAERRGERLPSRYFIFDRDDAPTSLTSSDSVRILQWKRRCLENYLLDIDILTDLLKDKDIVKEPLANQGEVTKLLSGLALSQLDDYVARRVYESYCYESPGLRSSEIQGRSPTEIAEGQWKRLDSIRAQLGTLDAGSWKEKFLRECADMRRQLESRWETTWREDSDGKRLFKDLHQRLHFRLPLRRFKNRIMTEMRSGPSESWRLIEGQVKALIESR